MRPVWLLDVDGVLNANRPKWSAPPTTRHLTVDGEHYRHRFAPALIREIRALLDPPIVDVRWATSWIPHREEIAALYGLPPFPPAFSDTLASQATLGAAKVTAAVTVAEQDNRPLIWTDDEDIPTAGDMLDRLTTARVPVLLIRPASTRGLTRDDMAQIRAFLAMHASG